MSLENWQGDWDKDTPYSPGETIRYKGSVYTSKTDSWGQEPPGPAWELFSDNVTKVVTEDKSNNIDATPYDKNTPYSGGELVEYEGKVYKAVDSSWGQAPPSDAWKLFTDRPSVPTEPESTDTSPVGTPDTSSHVFIIEQHGHDGQKGEQGNKGDQGEIGSQGIQGIAGLKGDKGDKGDTGNIGPQGPKGDKGEQGPPGETVHIDKPSNEPDRWTIGGIGRFHLKDATSSGNSLISHSKLRTASLKKIIAGTGITITSNANSLTINSSGSSSGTVTSFSFTNANGISGSVSNPTTTPALSLSLDNNSVTYAKLQQGSPRSLLGVTSGVTANYSAITATDNTIMRRDSSAATEFGFGSINLANTSFFVNQLQPGNGGLGNGTWTERSIPFFEGGVFAEDNTGDNQFIYKRTFGANGQLSLGSNHSFGIGTVFNTFDSTYSRGVIFADGSNLVPGASTSDLDMTLYVNGAASAPNISGTYGGAGLSWHTGFGGDNSNADEGLPSEAGSWDIFLGDSGAATGENPGNGANAAHFSLKFGSPGLSVNSDPGNPGFFTITSSKSSSLFLLDDGDGTTGNLSIKALTAITGTLSVSSQLVANAAQAQVDNIIRSKNDANLIRTSGSNDTVGIGIASPTAWLEIKAGTTSRAPLKLNTGNLISSPVAGSFEFLAPWLYFTGNTRQDKVVVETGTNSQNAKTAAITATTIYAVPSAGQGLYRVSVIAKVTTAGSISSVLGGTNGFQIKYTDATDSVVVTTGAVTNVSGLATNLNTTQAVYMASAIVDAAASSNIQYLFDYTSAGTAMQYKIKVVVEAI